MDLHTGVVYVYMHAIGVLMVYHHFGVGNDDIWHNQNDFEHSAGLWAMIMIYAELRTVNIMECYTRDLMGCTHAFVIDTDYI